MHSVTLAPLPSSLPFYFLLPPTCPFPYSSTPSPLLTSLLFFHPSSHDKPPQSPSSSYLIVARPPPTYPSPTPLLPYPSSTFLPLFFPLLSYLHKKGGVISNTSPLLSHSSCPSSKTTCHPPFSPLLNPLLPSQSSPQSPSFSYLIVACPVGRCHEPERNFKSIQDA